MAGAIEWLLWRVLHLLFALACALRAVFSRSQGFVSSFSAENRHVRAVVTEKPLTVAVVLENEEALDKDGKIPQLLSWLSAAKVSHVTLYDAQGILKRSQGQLRKTLNCLDTGDQTIHCYSEAELVSELTGSRYLKEEAETVNDMFTSADKCDKLMQNELSALRKRKGESLVSVDTVDDKPQLDVAGVNHMTVELLSLQDGKGSLVRAARHVCENAYKIHYAEKSTKGKKLAEEDINRSLQETGEGPDPDLLLLMGMTRSLLGFPPWRLRLTEIVHMGSLKDLTEQSFVSALKDFSKKTHRYGR